MGLLAGLHQVILAAADPVLGPLLALPRDAVIFIVALATATLLTLVRLFTTDQGLLRRCGQDKKTLNARIREAKRRDVTGDVERCVRAARNALEREGLDLPAGDVERLAAMARKRLRRREAQQLAAVKQMIAVKGLKQEVIPLAVVIVPVAFLAMWCFARLGYHPPRGGEPVEVAAHFPVSDAGKIAHLVPQEGMGAPGGWVTEIETVETGPEPYGLATWTVTAGARQEPYDLVIRYGDEQYGHELLVGARTYSDPVKLQKGGSRYHAIELKLRAVKLFNVVPGIPWIGFQPWLVAYLLITVPFVPLLKRLLGIH